MQKHFREETTIYKTINSVLGMTNLKMLGTECKMFKNKVDLIDIHNILDSQLSDIQYMAALLIMPINFDTAKYYIEIFQKIKYESWINHFKNKTQIDFDYKFGFVMKLIKACFICGIDLNEVQPIIDDFLKEEKGLTGAYFFMGCLMKKPLPELQPVITKNKRVDAISYYYAGLNRMLENNLIEAEKFLSYSLILSKFAKEIRGEIIHKLSLACYLNGTSYDLFISKINPEYRIKREHDDVWSERGCNAKYDEFTRLLEDMISKENIRRKIINMTILFSQIKISEISNKILLKDEETLKMLESMKNNMDIKYTIEGDIVKFQTMRLINEIEKEIKAISNS